MVMVEKVTHVVLPELSGLMIKFFSSSKNNIPENIFSNSSALQLSWSRTSFTSECSIPRCPRLVFLVGCMGCLIISAISHLLACHSRHFSLFFWRLDYAGISLMIVSSFVPPIYCLSPPTDSPAYLPFNHFHSSPSISCLLYPALSSLLSHPFPCHGLLWSCAGCPCHVVELGTSRNPYGVGARGVHGCSLCCRGTVVYVSRIPEKWRLGEFDPVGHTQRIFHLLVFFGAFIHSGHHCASQVAGEINDILQCILKISSHCWQSTSC